MTGFGETEPWSVVEVIDIEKIIHCLIEEGIYRADEIKELNTRKFEIKVRKLV